MTDSGTELPAEVYVFASAVDQLAHGAAEILASSLLAGHRDDRLWLYIWEQELLLGLQRYRGEGGTVPLNSWTMHFLRMNLDAIKADYQSGSNSRMDFNLKADTARRLAAGEELAW